MMKGVLPQAIADTPIAVIDFETTGLSPGEDRAVEVSIVRIDPGQPPTLAFDSLIHPERPVDATHIHGITDHDVARAPRFRDIAGEVLNATAGCVLAAYNSAFDMKFLRFELETAGVKHQPPHCCLMYLRPLLNLGHVCKLDQACRAHGVRYRPTHRASSDAMAAGLLFQAYQQVFARRNIATFADLAQHRHFIFTRSFSQRPFPAPDQLGLARSAAAVSRADR